MAYIGKNPKVASVTYEGFADFATADASAKRQGRLVFVQATNEFYKDDGAALSNLGGAASGVGFWNKPLSTNLNSDGTVGDLAVTGMTIGKHYQVILNVRAKRLTTGADEIQELTFSATPTYGLFQIEFDGQTTTDIPYDSNAAEVQTKLEALSNITGGDVVVSGDFTTGFTLSWGGTKANTDVAEVTIPSNSLTTGETGGTNEVQDLTFSATPTGGSFTISYDGETTGTIAYNAAIGTVEAALELLPNINGCTVSALGAGYRITFDGTLVEKRDVVQSTGNSSLTETVNTVTSPSGWDSITSVSTVDYGTVPTTPIPNIYTEGANSALTYVVGPNYAGGNLTATVSPNGSILFYSPNVTGTFNVKIRWKPSIGSNFLLLLHKGSAASRNFSGASTSLASTPPTGTGSFILQDLGTYVLTNEFFQLQVNNFVFGPTSSPLEIDYVIITQTTSGPVSITPTTFTAGVAPTGGTGTTATPSTTQSGVASVAGPAKLFGAKVVHDSADVIEAKYLPSAQSAEDAEATVQNETIIEATSTSISVESEGLGGPEFLEASDTRLVVIEQDNATEN
jgi:hypothetical protein